MEAAVAAAAMEGNRYQLAVNAEAYQGGHAFKGTQ
jgi:hypothetical protein